MQKQQELDICLPPDVYIKTHNYSLAGSNPAYLYPVLYTGLRPFRFPSLLCLNQRPALALSLELHHVGKNAALMHHERCDGSGYPFGLTGNRIDKFAKIVSIADVYDALTSERCYRKSLSNYNACKILKEDVQSGKLNSAYLSALLSNIAVYPNGIVVYLSDGTHGIVKAQNPDLLYQPVIRIIDDRDPDGKISVYDLDLATRSDVSIIEP